jgi:hypothetical protein
MLRHLAHAAALSLAAFAVPALAHTGHVAEEAGHSHVLGIGALAAAGVIAIVAVLRHVLARRRKAALNG